MAVEILRINWWMIATNENKLTWSRGNCRGWGVKREQIKSWEWIWYSKRCIRHWHYQERERGTCSWLQPPFLLRWQAYEPTLATAVIWGTNKYVSGNSFGQPWLLGYWSFSLGFLSDKGRGVVLVLVWCGFGVWVFSS